MPMSSNPDFEALVRSTGLEKFGDTLKLVEHVYTSYRQQLDTLHDVDLQGEEVQTAYQHFYDQD